MASCAPPQSLFVGKTCWLGVAALLTTANFSMDMWNFACTNGIRDISDTPIEIKSKFEGVHRSPNHRWFGYTPKRKRIIFGADANVFTPIPQREYGDKIGARSKGGDGRYRYLGPDEELGSESKGDQIFDLVERRMMIVSGALYLSLIHI